MKNQGKNLVSSFGSGNQNQEEYPEKHQEKEEGSERKVNRSEREEDKKSGHVSPCLCYQEWSKKELPRKK